MGGGGMYPFHAWPNVIVTIDRRILTMPRWSTSGFHRSGVCVSGGRGSPALGKKAQQFEEDGFAVV